jgi:MFS family permease
VAAADRVLAGIAAVLLGLAYGLCLVSGLRQAEQMAGPTQRGSVVACYYALAYLGFAAPYLAAGLGAVTSQAGAFGILAGIAVVVAAWTAACALIMRRTDPIPPAELTAEVARPHSRLQHRSRRRVPDGVAAGPGSGSG